MPRKTHSDFDLVASSVTALAPSQVIKLTGTEKKGLFEQELRGVELTGLLRDHKSARACNVIETAIHNFNAERVNFTRCDFKDSAIKSSHFKRTNFNLSSMAYNTVSKTTFEDCSFQETDIQNCEFDQTVFTGCDLRHLLIKACSFSRCEFRKCETNNQLFEMCRLTDCVFKDTDLQIQTIAENFGIVAVNFESGLRDNRADGPHHKLAVSDLPEWLVRSNVNPLQKLSVQYFLSGTLLEGSAYLDESLELSSWIRMFKTAGSFTVVLNRWVEFLLHLYSRNQLTVHVVIRLHSMTDGLLRGLGDGSTHHQALASISGVHLSLARIVDEYLTILENCNKLANSQVCFLVEGHRTKKYYYRVLAPFFARSSATITKLVRHNSPWDLGVTFAASSSPLFFMALFLATRTRIELARISQRTDVTTSSPEPLKQMEIKKGGKNLVKPAPNRINTESIFTLDFGGAGQLSKAPSFRLRAYLPGNLVADLQLDVATQQIAKLRKTIKDIL